jgi:hypothetical protein
MAIWDETSAIVAIISFVAMLMLSQYGPILATCLKWVFIQLFSKHKLQCETLCWHEIPDGLIQREGLHKEDPFIHWACSIAGESEPSDSMSCFESVYGRIFETAWQDTGRRQRRVSKPRDLGVEIPYIRTDAKTMQCLMLAHEFESDTEEDSCFIFELVGRTMTARYSGTGSLLAHPFTKRELELLLEGYPPLYQEYIRLPNGAAVPNPIRNHEDIEKAGWIVHCGLSQKSDFNCDAALPARKYNMSLHPNLDGPFSEQTVIQHALERLRVTLRKFKAVLPGDEEVSKALQLYQELKSDNVTIAKGTGQSAYDNIKTTDPFQVDRRLRYIWLRDSEDYANQLDARQWQLAFQIFTHYGDMTPEEILLVQKCSTAILKAALKGMVRVVLYGKRAWNLHKTDEFKTLGKLPSMPQARGYKHIYLRACSIEERG